MSQPTALTVAEAIGEALADRVAAEDYDLVVEGDAIDLATDDWTLHLDGFPEASGWIAIDNQPDDASEYAEAMRGSFQRAEIDALRVANEAVSGLIATALERSGDELSAVFAGMLRAV